MDRRNKRLLGCAVASSTPTWDSRAAHPDGAARPWPPRIGTSGRRQSLAQGGCASNVTDTDGFSCSRIAPCHESRSDDTTSASIP